MRLFERLKKKKDRRPEPPPSARRGWTLQELFSGKRRHEVQGIALWMLSLLLAAAFWPHAAGHNALGPAGEVTFRLGFALLGGLVYALPFALAFIGGLMFRAVEVEHRTAKWVGLLLAAWSLGMLLEFLWPRGWSFQRVDGFYIWPDASAFWSNIPRAFRLWDQVTLAAGGWPAAWGQRLLVAVFSPIGTYIVCATLLVIALYLLEAESVLGNLVASLRGGLKAAVERTQAVSDQIDYAPVQPLPELKPKPGSHPPRPEEGKPKIKIAVPPAAPAGRKPGGAEPKPSPAPAVVTQAAAVPEQHFDLPGLDLLIEPKRNQALTREYFETMSHTLENALAQFNVAAKVVEVCPGPVVTRYELQPAAGVKVNSILSLADDIALAMRAEHVRMEAPIPGKGAVGIELPNQVKETVVLKELLGSEEFQRSDSVLSFAVGKDIGGKHIFAQLENMPHLLIAGATGSGKSACINGIICSLLYKATPVQVRFLMIDPKRVELTIYNGIPHLKSPVITDSREAAVALKILVREMEDRYRRLAQLGVRDIVSYNQRAAEERGPEGRAENAVLTPMPYIVVFIDELADLMLISANEVENAITRLAQMARGVGIHLVLATQRPSVDVITGLIKANFPSRIAFQVSSKVDSRTILDANGADALLGRGDMLYSPASASKPLRVQGVFVTTPEVDRLVQFWKLQGAPEFDQAFTPGKLAQASAEGANGEGEDDELFDQAVAWVVRAKQASTSMLQRRLKIGYSRAARLLDLMEQRGIVGPPDGSRPRKVLVDPLSVDTSLIEEPEDPA